jgi:nuclear pore complex protein Nup160
MCRVLIHTPAASANPWKETIYNSQSWTQGLRSLIPFQGKSSILHGKINMDPSAATSIAITDLGLEGASFLFTVCLDHRMRIWNLHTGQILFTGDILNSERNPQEVGKWIVDPSHSNLLQIVGDKVGERTCATYSPLGAGEFKFWTIKAHDPETIYVEDRFPDIPLVPASPSLSDVWTLTDFVLSSFADGRIQLWALWKNNMTYRIQELDLDKDHMDQCWESEWASVSIDSAVEPAQTSSTADSTDVTEKWLALILAPGRFTKTTLETALSIYERGLGAEKDGSTRAQKGLAESICSIIASTASLDRKATGEIDYEQFRASSEIQWRRFHRLLLEMDKQRGEAVSLVLDPSTGLTWVVCADALSAIRECSALERLYHNLSRPEEEYEAAATLISTGLGFLDAFSDQMLQVCASALRPELFEETSRTDYERLQHMWDATGFWRAISEEDCKEVTDNLGQKFSLVTTQLYNQVFDLLSLSIDARHRNVRHPLTDFGRRLVVKAVQDTVELQWRICMSQLMMLVHMEFDWEQEEDMLSRRVDVGLVFRQCLDSLRRLELLRWLANTEVAVPLHTKVERSGSFSGGSPNISKKPEEALQVVTALEGNVGHLLGFADPKSELLASSITQLVTGLCASDSDIEVSPTLIQCALIRQDRADLADQLTPYCDQTPFSVYIQGRISVALKCYDAAAFSFRKAAVGMSKC